MRRDVHLAVESTRAPFEHARELDARATNASAGSVPGSAPTTRVTGAPRLASHARAAAWVQGAAAAETRTTRGESAARATEIPLASRKRALAAAASVTNFISRGFRTLTVA